MKKYYNVQGSMPTVPYIEVNVDTVYIRENIKKIETEDFTGWEYDEIQMTLREYQESESDLLRQERKRSEELERSQRELEGIIVLLTDDN